MNGTNTIQKTIPACSQLFQAKELHPLTNIIDLSEQREVMRLKVDSYSVLLESFPAEKFYYGRKSCDFSGATLTFHAPDKTIQIGAEDNRRNAPGTLLLFHPCLLWGTALSKKIRSYSFFRYLPDEALHVSACEKRVIERCLDDIQEELKWGIDGFSSILLCNKIELLLNYCLRYYQRQFIMRHDVYAPVVEDVSRGIDAYIKSGKAGTNGMPHVSDFARPRGMSSAYLNDLMLHETGKEFHKYAELRRVEIAGQMLEKAGLSDDGIAKLLGYKSVASFRMAFKRQTGTTVDLYRN